jgi:hypothetical protein
MRTFVVSLTLLLSLGSGLALAQETPTERDAARSVVRQLDDLERSLNVPAMIARLTGQNGLSDYDVGFTNFLYTFEVSPGTRQSPPAAGALRARRPG